MSLDHTKDGCFYFKYEHNKEYRQIQYSFWEAVSSLNPANIVVSIKSCCFYCYVKPFVFHRR